MSYKASERYSVRQIREIFDGNMPRFWQNAVEDLLHHFDKQRFALGNLADAVGAMDELPPVRVQEALSAARKALE